MPSWALRRELGFARVKRSFESLFWLYALVVESGGGGRFSCSLLVPFLACVHPSSRMGVCVLEVWEWERMRWKLVIIPLVSIMYLSSSRSIWDDVCFIFELSVIRFLRWPLLEISWFLGLKFLLTGIGQNGLLCDGLVLQDRLIEFS